MLGLWLLLEDLNFQRVSSTDVTKAKTKTVRTIVKEGIKEGIKKGIKEGRQEGRQEGELLLLQRLLAFKFEPLDEVS